MASPIRTAAAFVLLSAVLHAAGAARPVDKQQVKQAGDVPAFCHDLECPRYVVADSPLAQYPDAELREYEAAVWVSTNVSDVEYDKAVQQGFMRLFAYIAGANKAGKKIDMTAPVRVLLIPGAGPFCESRFKISFFVPFELQSNPPAPTSADVFVEREGAKSLYALSYGGYSSESKVLAKAAELLALIENQKLPHDTSHFFSAGYDSPFHLFNRHNEVWIPAKAV